MSAPTFKHLQLAFAAHMRDPDRHPAPEGIEPRRVRVYRGLIYNNVRSFMHKGFPVLLQVLGTAVMDRLVQDWLAEHRATTPLFPRMPGEFVTWLQRCPDLPEELPLWVRDLAHYEWMELDLSLAEDIKFTEGNRLQLSALARVLEYEWPVHMIAPDWLPTAPLRTTLLVYRNEQDAVRFLETAPMTHAFLNALQNHGPVGFAELLSTLGDPATLAAPAQVLLDDLLGRGVIWRVL